MKGFHFLDVAGYYESIIDTYDMTQQELAQRLGITQSAVANSLRLLSLPISLRRMLRSSDLTSRHARGLLRLETEEAQTEAFLAACGSDMSVKDFDRYVDELLLRSTKPNKGRSVKVFLRTLKWAIGLLARGGVKAEAFKRDRGDHFEVIVRIPKN